MWAVQITRMVSTARRRSMMRLWIVTFLCVAFCYGSAATLERDYTSPHQRDSRVGSDFSQNTVPYGGDQQVQPAGSAVLVPMEHHQVTAVRQPPPLPQIDLEHVALSLRFTSEMNRRISHGASHSTQAPSLQATPPIDMLSSTSNHVQSVALEQRGGGPVNVHPSKQWVRPIQPAKQGALSPQLELTLFHAKAPRKVNKKIKIRPRGCSHWGPDLHLFLKHITEALDIAQERQPIVLALTMIYMDRACSVETPRSPMSSNYDQNGNLLPAQSPIKCPNVTPRTVHRLAVVALLIAHKAVNGGTTEEYWMQLKTLGIPLDQLLQMEEWMLRAMGESGLFVPEEHLYRWLKSWHKTFSASKARVNPRPPQ